MIERCFFTLCVCLIVSGCATPGNIGTHRNQYDLEDPDTRLKLPSILQEISGITQVQGDTFACIQDEKGIVFLINAQTGSVIRELPFTGDGDFEGIARVNDTLYVLQSDGILYELPQFLSPESGFIAHETGIPAQNNEGLCFDPLAHRLLIACKSNISKGTEARNVRAIYSFDLHTKKLSTNPTISLHIEDLQEYAIDHEMDVPYKKKKKDKAPVPEIKFRTSAIAVHPMGGRIYLLSATDHMICILKRNGDVDQLIQLDKTIFNKPEGIAFSADNAMIITNEGQEKHPTLLSFTMK